MGKLINNGIDCINCGTICINCDTVLMKKILDLLYEVGSG